MVTETENARMLESGEGEDSWVDDFLDSGSDGFIDHFKPNPDPAPEPEPPHTDPAASEPVPEPEESAPTAPPTPESPSQEGDSGDTGHDTGGSAPQPEDSKQDGGYFIGELTDDPDPEETDIMDALATGAPGEGTMVLIDRKKVEQEPVTEQPEPAPSPELVENYWLKGGLLVAIAIIVCLLFQNPRRKKS